MAETKKALLVVDDEPDNLDLIERVFKDDFEVVRATSGPAALELCKKRSFSVIISDHRMPEMTGIEFLQETISTQPDCVRIVVTAYDDREIIVGAINRVQACRFFSKPFDVNEMKDAVRSALSVVELQAENRRLVEELGHRNEALEKNRQDLLRYSRLLKEYAQLLQELDQDLQ